MKRKTSARRHEGHEVKIMGNSYRNSDSSRTSGFTLAEMLVAVGMGVMLVVAAAGVFSLATQAVGSSQANTQINNKLRVLFSWLDRDFARIRLDGPLVLDTQEADLDADGTNDRFDLVSFLISGDIPSMHNDYSAGLAIVCYGPDDAVSNVPLAEPHDWIFTRRGTLIASEPLASGVWPADAQQSSFAQVMVDYFASVSSGSWAGIWLTALTRANFDYDPASHTYDFTTNPNELSTHLLANVMSFKFVRYYMASTDTESAAERTFGPAEEKPAWIEFEITLRDSNNRLQEGYTSRYRVNLPSR